MHIVFTVHHDLNRNSGASGTTLAIADQCQQVGHQTTLVSHSDLPPSWPARKKRLLFPAFLSRRLRRLCREKQVDVIDASSGDAWLWDSFPRGKDRPLSVFRTHGLEHLAHAQKVAEARAGRIQLSWRHPVFGGGFNLWAVAHAARRADACVFLNEADRDYAVQRLGVRRETSVVIPNGLPDYLRNLPVPKPSRPPWGIAFVGSYLARKGVAYLAQAIGDLMRQVPSLQLRLLGTGCGRPTVLEDYPQELHDRVQVVPEFEHRQLPNLLSGCQLLLFPSLYEGFGKALLEAMACGLAPVAFDIPGPREIIGEAGCLVPARNAAALREAALSLIADPAKLDESRRSAHAQAQQFHWPALVDQRLAFYDRIRHQQARDATGVTPLVT